MEDRSRKITEVCSIEQRMYNGGPSVVHDAWKMSVWEMCGGVATLYYTKKLKTRKRTG